MTGELGSVTVALNAASPSILPLLPAPAALTPDQRKVADAAQAVAAALDKATDPAAQAAVTKSLKVPFLDAPGVKAAVSAFLGGAKLPATAMPRTVRLANDHRIGSSIVFDLPSTALAQAEEALGKLGVESKVTPLVPLPLLERLAALPRSVKARLIEAHVGPAHTDRDSRSGGGRGGYRDGGRGGRDSGYGRSGHHGGGSGFSSGPRGGQGYGGGSRRY